VHAAGQARSRGLPGRPNMPRPADPAGPAPAVLSHRGEGTRSAHTAPPVPDHHAAASAPARRAGPDSAWPARRVSCRPPAAWPVAVVAKSPDDRLVVFHTYCSQWPVDERRHVRPVILKPGPAHPGDVIGRHQAAVAAGDAEAVVRTFAPDGHFRGPFGPRYAHRGTAELRSFFTDCFSAGGGIGLEHCAVTDDGVRCALEFNCVRWGQP
jgi:SnoaL-like domain